MADITPKYGIPYPQDGDFITPKSLEDMATSIENLLSGKMSNSGSGIITGKNSWTVQDQVAVKTWNKAILSLLMVNNTGADLTANAAGNIADTTIGTLTGAWAANTALIQNNNYVGLWRMYSGQPIGSFGTCYLSANNDLIIGDGIPNGVIPKLGVISVFLEYPLAVA